MALQVVKAVKSQDWGHYRACMDNELSPRLLALIEKLKNEREILAEEIEPIRKAENECLD